jgi:hypothetical protein
MDIRASPPFRIDLLEQKENIESIGSCSTAMYDPWKIEELGDDVSGICACCGGTSRMVRGIIRHEDHDLAMFIVHWTLGRVAKHGASFDLIVNFRPDNTAPVERCLISLSYRLVDGIPSFMVIDSKNRVVARSPLVTCPLNRADVIGTPLAPDIFSICDEIIERDSRIAELLGHGPE